ncbi:hypothetical protein GCM10028771_11830 [Nocardioides marmoraquaticus]
MKQAAEASAWIAEARSAWAGSATVTTGCSTTSVNRPPMPTCSIVARASSSYAVTTTPWVTATCRYDSRWHCDSAARSSSSGFHRAGSPRKGLSADPSSSGLPDVRSVTERS